MAIAKDESTGAGRGRVVDPKRDGALVIYRSDFDAGFDNWTDHWDGYRPWPVVSLSSRAAHVGNRSLMLSTGEHASPVAGDVSSTAATFKRMAIYQDWRFHSFSAYLALGSGGYSAAWSTFSLFIDTQEYDNSQRSFYKVQAEVRPGPDYSRFQIRGDGGETDFRLVPGSEKKWIGDNDNKQGFGYIRLTIDKEANGGLGGYHELQVNKSTFDLTTLGAGSSIETPQDDGSTNITQFNGGWNIGLGLSRNTAQAGGCQLYADDIVYSVSNTH